MFLNRKTSSSTSSFWDKKENLPEKLQKLSDLLQDADAIVIGAGAGLSTSAGFLYTGERFSTYFPDFIQKYAFRDMYSGGFYPFQTLEEHWAYWSRYIYINRYMDPPKPVYSRLYELVSDKDYFVLTTNVDHCFQKAGFDKHRLFYTQGDYGLFQCSKPCCQKTYNNEEIIREMVLSQGYTIASDGSLLPPPNDALKRTVPSKLIPHCPVCGAPMSMNLRADATFVEDEGWHLAAERYSEFLRRHKNTKILFLELAVGYNTPSIIKYSFWHMSAEWEKAFYVCLNLGQAGAPEELKNKSLCINGDIGEILSQIYFSQH